MIEIKTNVTNKTVESISLNKTEVITHVLVAMIVYMIVMEYSERSLLSSCKRFK